MSVNLMKGLKDPSTIDSTTATLNLLLELESQAPRPVVSEDVNLRKIGFLVPILSLAERNSNLLFLAGIKDEIEDLQLISIKRKSGALHSSSDNFKKIIQFISSDLSISTLTVSMVL
jgi:hypothetical protein